MNPKRPERPERRCRCCGAITGPRGGCPLKCRQRDYDRAHERMALPMSLPPKSPTKDAGFAITED